MAKQITVCPVADLPPGAVTGAGPYAIGNIDGKYFAVTRRCRHLRADLAGGSIEDGRLVCPWHQSAYDVDNGQMQRHRRRITGAPARFACPFLEPPSERLPISKAVVTVEDPYLTHPAWRVQSASASPGSAKTTLIEHRQIRARPSDVPPNLVATSAHTYARRLAASLSRCRAARAITCCLLRPRPSNRAGSAPDGSRSGAQFAA